MTKNPYSSADTGPLMRDVKVRNPSHFDPPEDWVRCDQFAR
jgi:hypothetical protein